MVEKKGGEPKYVPVPPESAGWGEIRRAFTASSRMKKSAEVEGGEAVWKEVLATAYTDPDTGELKFLSGGDGEVVRWYDLRGILPEDQVEKVEKELRKIANRRRGK